VQHAGAALLGVDVELHAFGRLRRHVARPFGEVAGDALQIVVREQEHGARAAPAVAAQLERRRDLVDAAEAQVVGQVVHLGAHDRRDLALQRVAGQ